MSGEKRRLSEIEDLDDDEREAAAIEARENGLRAHRHWKDRGEPPARTERVAMRQACPYRPHDPRSASFFAGWRGVAGEAFDYVWVGNKHPERKGQVCRVLKRARNLVDVEFPDGTTESTVSWWVRKVA